MSEIFYWILGGVFVCIAFSGASGSGNKALDDHMDRLNKDSK